MLDLRRVSVSRGAKTVLHDLTLRIAAGEHVAILGPNGCGKSTLIKTITRECYPLARRGSFLRIFGEDHWNIFDLRSLLGIVSGDLMSLCTRDITGRDIVLSGFFSSIGVWPHQQVSAGMRDKCAEALDLLEAPHLAERFVSEMSSGEAHRVLIARALVHKPQALLLDEPSTSLDLRAQHDLREILRKLAQSGIGIVLVTHHLSDIIPEVERVILLRDGRIVADGAKRKLLTPASLANLFGVPVDIAQRGGYYHAW